MYKSAEKSSSFFEGHGVMSSSPPGTKYDAEHALDRFWLSSRVHGVVGCCIGSTGITRCGFDRKLVRSVAK